MTSDDDNRRQRIRSADHEDGRLRGQWVTRTTTMDDPSTNPSALKMTNCITRSANAKDSVDYNDDDDTVHSPYNIMLHCNSHTILRMSSAAFLKTFYAKFLAFRHISVYILFDDELLVVTMLFPSGKSTSQNDCKCLQADFLTRSRALANYTLSLQAAGQQPASGLPITRPR